MKKIVILAFKDLRVLFSDRSNFFWVFGFPALFALFFGAIFSGSDSGPSGMKIAVVDLDKSEFSASYISKLESYEALKVVKMNRNEAIDGIRKGNIFAAVILKDGFGDDFETMFTGDNSAIEIALDPGRKMEGQYLQGLISRALFEVMAERFTDRDWMRKQVGNWRDEITDSNDLGSDQAELFLGFFDAYDKLLEDVNNENYRVAFDGDMMNFAVTDVTRERKGPVTAFQITFPQAIVWGVLGCSVTFAISIVQERKKGTFERLRLGPIGRAHILGGKGLACCLTCIFIVCFLFAGAKLIFAMPLRNLPLFVLAVVCVILCFVGLMMFICTLGRTEQGAAGAGWAMFMVMAMLGGGMIPLFFMPAWLQKVSNISFVKWSILALEGGIWRNLTFIEMLRPFAVLLAIGSTAFIFGVIMLARQDK
jgi:ABC-2 type transport system permease protein